MCRDNPSIKSTPAEPEQLTGFAADAAAAGAVFQNANTTQGKIILDRVSRLNGCKISGNLKSSSVLY